MQGSWQLALEYTTEGLNMRRRIHAHRDTSDVKNGEIGTSLLNLALIYKEMKDFNAARQCMRESADVQIAIASTTPQDCAKTAVILDHLATLITENFDDELVALHCYLECLKYRRLAHATCGQSAECYIRLNDLTYAARHCDEVMTVCGGQGGPFAQLSGLAKEWSGGIHRALAFAALDNHEYTV
eukprot:gene8162-10383_t